MKAYIVRRSNCEPYEDYYTWIDSVWSDRDSAVAYIEGDLGMVQKDFKSSDREWSEDRWLRTDYEYMERSDCEDEEEWAEWHDDDGNLIPIASDSTDAWIEEFEIDAPPEQG